jgi:Rod binding domain-containing protein
MEVPSLLAAPTVAAPAADKPKDAAQASKQFEAMLIAQMLQSTREAARDEDNEDSTNSTMLDLADQQFARMLAEHGGIGLGRLIGRSLPGAG